jgi:hypothetical protein
MIIECQYCDALVDAKVLKERDFGATDDFDPHKYLFLECPACNSMMLGWAELEPITASEWDWGNPVRLYPEPPYYLDPSIPKLVRHALEEAKKCLRVNVILQLLLCVERQLRRFVRKKLARKL